MDCLKRTSSLWSPILVLSLFIPPTPIASFFYSYIFTCSTKGGFSHVGWFLPKVDRGYVFPGIFQGNRNPGFSRETERQLMQMKNKTESKALPLGHSSLDRERRWKDPVKIYMLSTRVEEVGDPWEEVALDAISRDFGDQGGVPDCIKGSRYV